MVRVSKASIFAVEVTQFRDSALSDIQQLFAFSNEHITAQDRHQNDCHKKQVNTSRSPPSTNAESLGVSAFSRLVAHYPHYEFSHQQSLAIAQTAPGSRQAHITFGASLVDFPLIHRPSPCPRKPACDRRLGNPPIRLLVGCSPGYSSSDMVVAVVFVCLPASEPFLLARFLRHSCILHRPCWAMSGSFALGSAMRRRWWVKAPGSVRI